MITRMRMMMMRRMVKESPNKKTNVLIRRFKNQSR
jgi:hypothetical protein